MSHPTYKLTYFDARGVAEAVRFVFAYAKVPFEDVRISHDSPADWPALKPKTPFRQLPYLEIDGEVYGQSAAFTRLVAKKYNLAGATDEEQAHVDAIADYIKDIWNSIYKFWMEPDAEKKEKLRDEYFKTGLVEHLDVLESHLNSYGKGKFFVPSGVTWADFVVATFAFTLQKHFPATLEQREALKAHMERVNNLPGIKEWIAKRPQTQN
ncbi:putative Glutathione S-transferase 1 [Hypsibius exemplaris]|uniref:glutathione transferase n=1 Tax=Hypsibius exemplaris TaxID=2072580 RepID=A0A1W0X530_HYPEX|nr:putative Glutathione S-transferase 1 [Hypsibius exemplaris]